MADILDIDGLGSPVWNTLDEETWDSLLDTDSWETFGMELSEPDFVYSEFQIHSPALESLDLDTDAKRKTPISYDSFQTFVSGNYTYEKCLVKLAAETAQTSETLPEFTKLVHYVYTT